MKARYDHRTDTLTLVLMDGDKVAESDEDKPGVILDYDANGEVVGVEILSLSERGVDINKLDSKTLRPPATETLVREAPPPYGKQ